MTPTPQDNTARAYLFYNSAGFSHRLLLRFASGTSSADMLPTLNAVGLQLANLLRAADSVSGAGYSAAGSSVVLPIVYAPQVGQRNNALQVGDAESHYIDVPGRGISTGAKTRWTVFVSTSDLPNPGPNRYYPGSIPTQVDGFMAALEDAAADPTHPIVTIKGDVPNIYTYVNTGYNYHWQRTQR